MHLNYMQNLSSCITDNTGCVHYEDQMVSEV